VVVHVDEARSDDEPLCVDRPRCRPVRKAAERCDAACLDAQIANEPGVARAIDNAPVSDQNVEILCAQTRGQR
jgi:hypothetical protein